MEITREDFEEQRRPRFGTSNPERMRYSFWEWMIRGDDPLPVEEGVLGKFGMMMREGIIKSRHGPYRARDLFQVTLNRDDGPIWTFDRMGSTQTEMPDGRVIHIGGEHEDFYDPDFCIYNDVVVFLPEGKIEIYGYPRKVFPPTDFHSATLIDDQIFIIGRIGYEEDGNSGPMPVYRLDTTSYSITKVTTTGDSPGWLSRHRAEVDEDGLITFRDGKIFVSPDSPPRRNFDTYSLDTATGLWRCVGRLRSRQFVLRRNDREHFRLDQHIPREQFYPIELPGVEFMGVCDEEPNQGGWFRWKNGGACVHPLYWTIDVIVFGTATDDAKEFVDAVKHLAENAVGVSFDVMEIP